MDEIYAADALKESMEKTLKLLFPIDAKLWLKLALVVMIASIIGSTNFRVNISSDIAPTADQFFAIFLIIILFALCLLYAASESAFVFMEIIKNKKAELTKYYKRQAKNGAHLFVLNLVLLVFMLLVAIIVMGSFMASIINANPASSALLMFTSILGIILLYTSMIWLIIDFMAPIMYAKNKGVIAAFTEMVNLIEKNILQFIIYAAIRTVIAIVGVLAYILVAIPLMLGMLFAIMLLTMVTNPIFIIIPMFFGMIIVGYILNVITLPISVFIRYYSIIFLQKIDKEIKIVK